MCGIAGYVGGGDLRRMLECISHRGPDRTGVWEGENVALGCNRLAVIDIEGGRQPLFDENGGLIVYNGEIFNFPEIRKELEKKQPFKTKSDTEVILRAYREWGAECLSKFNGMFAFAIWDGEKLFMARDRMGEKPFYYHNGPDGFFFASEIKAILSQVEGRVRFTPEFDAFEYPCGEDTYYENIKALEPGCYLEYVRGDLKKKRYWSIPVGERMRERSDREYVEEFRELIENAVAIRLRSDVPVGIFLSGGLDSAMIAALAGPMDAFSCRFPDGDVFDEWEYARIAAGNVGLTPRQVTPTFEDFRNKLPKILWHLDGPISTMSSIGEFSLAAEAKDRVKVVLGGQGGDELLGGYVRYLLMLEEARIAATEPLKNYVPLARKIWGEDFGDDPASRYFKLICRNGRASGEAADTVRRLFDVPGGLLDKMSFADIHLQLPALLTMNDRAAAAYGIENRCPFLDYRIVEFAFRLPEELRIRDLRTKWILREAARGLVPDAIVDRVDKKGLVTPVGEWLAGPLKGWVKNLLGDDIAEYDTGPLGIFDHGLYHAVSLKVWETVRTSPLKPPEP